MTTTIIQAILPLWGYLIVGYLLRRAIPRSQVFWRWLNQISYLVLLPLTIFALLVGAGALAALSLKLGLVLFAAYLILFTALALSYLRISALRQHTDAYSSMVQTATRLNVPAGVLLTTTLVGASADAAVGTIIIATVPLINFANVLIIMICHRPPHSSVLTIARMTAFNPLVIACTAGLGCLLFGVDLPAAPAELLTIIAQIGPPAMLVGIGASLDGLRIQGQMRFVVAANIAKLLALPMLVLALGWMVALGPLHLLIAVIFAALPTAPNGLVLALQFGGDIRTYSAALLWQTVAAIATLPFWIWLAAAA